jgi:hypothetical protein
MTALVVAMIGLGALAVARIERRRSDGAFDAAQASAAARAGVEYAFFMIRSETTWSNLSIRSVAWASSVPFAGGTFSVTRTAYDNTDPLNDRLTLLAVGTHGDAVYQLQVVVVGGTRVDTSGWTQVVN